METDTDKFLNIKSWSIQDRPREKLLQKGRTSLSDAELIAILLGSGTSSATAVDVAKKLLVSAGNDLSRLGQLTVKDYMKVKGIGVARALSVISALELGRRRKDSESPELVKINTSADAYSILSTDFEDIQHEEFWILLVNRANRVIKKQQISLGGVAGTVADPKIIFKLALNELASGVVLAHNHPSGNLKASQADIALTKKMSEAGKLLEIQVLDHLIISGKKYFSFADEGML